MKLGEKIKTLRKQRNISQEVLANYLGISFQSVSKWENESTLPDVMMIPAIASFFGISTDELFEYNLYEVEREVELICNEAYKYRDSDPTKSEQILREGLKRFPGNDILLDNLLYTLDFNDRSDEIISLCKSLIESTKDDSVKYDACRLLAMCYKENGRQDLCESTLEKIPEIYFTKLGLMATLLEGEKSYEAAVKQRNLSLNSLIEMLSIIKSYHEQQGDYANAELQLEAIQKLEKTFCKNG